MKTYDETMDFLTKERGGPIFTNNDRFQLQGVNLTSINLKNLDLTHADLTKAKITKSQINDLLEALDINVVNNKIGTIEIINGRKYMITDNENDYTFGAHGILYKKL